MVRGTKSEPRANETADQSAAFGVTNLLHSRNSELLVDFGPDAFDFDTDVGAFLDDLVIVIGPVWRCCVGIILDFGRDHLPAFSAREWKEHGGIYTARLTKHSREPQLTKKPERTTEVTTPST